MLKLVEDRGSVSLIARVDGVPTLKQFRVVTERVTKYKAVLILEVNKMALTLAEKQAVVAEVADAAGKAISAVVADYRGLTVAEMTQLRSEARKSGVYLRIVRNTLTKRAFKGTGFECLNDALVGPLFIALSNEAPGDAARILRDFAKPHEKLQVKALSVGGVLYQAEQLDAVANLPTYDEAISKLMFVMKAPIEKFVRTMAEPYAKLVRTFAAVADKKKAE